jgi:hypothetical protein
MRFVQQEGVWLLVGGPDDNRVIATLRNETEVLALAEFCKLTLTVLGRVPEHFSISHNGIIYTVTPLGAPGEKLSLVIAGASYSATVQTEFTMAAETP